MKVFGGSCQSRVLLQVVLASVWAWSGTGSGGARSQTPVNPVPSPSPAARTPAAAPATPPADTSATPTQEPAIRQGTVLFQSHGEPPGLNEDELGEGLKGGRKLMPTPEPTAQAPSTAIPDLTDQERESLTITSYSLDLRLQPRSAGLAMRAAVTLRNDAQEPLRRVPLQVSSTLRWESANQLRPGGQPQPLAFVQHTIDSDADHTGKVSEGIVTLSEPLAPGASATLDVLYAGTLAPSTGRLQRIGATAEQAAGVDWDGVMAGDAARATALRGFGNVLWYPVISPQLFLGSGNELFRSVGAMRRRGEQTTVSLRFTTEYAGDPPAAVYFCGRREDFKALSDATDAPIASGTGVAVAEFKAASVGFRTLSLFVAERPEVLLAPLPTEGAGVAAAATFSSSTAKGTTLPALREAASIKTGGSPANPMLAVETNGEGALAPLTVSAERVAPLLMSWFGTRPLSTLTVLDAPGQPFQDGPLLRASVASLSTPAATGVLAHSMTSAWVQSGFPWMDEGLGQFMELLWTEQTAGRSAALAQLAESMTPVNLAEPGFERVPTTATQTGAIETGGTGNAPDSERFSRSSTEGSADKALIGEPLVDAQSELFYRRKAGAVWWMLRDIAGDDALRQALSAWRVQTPATRGARAEAEAFQRLLERTSSKDLQWFFDDWIFRDRGLPDLTLVNVTPRQLPAGQGHDSGWLVAVTVRNDGAAVAEVPLVVRSGSFSSTKRLRVPGFGSATERVLVEAPPTEVLVNDGSVPEVRVTVHSRTINVHGS